MSINWDTDLGRRALARITSEDVLWLTTVAPSGMPQPRPVWFVWEQETFLIYSQSTARKLAHVARNPQVALHFNTDAGGEDVQVILGEARVDPAAPPVQLNAAYLEKYRAGLAGLGMDAARYAEMFNVALRVTPLRLRGLEPLPEH